MEGNGRRQFSWYQKQVILKEHFDKGLSISRLARKYQIHPVTLYGWKRMFTMTKENPLPQADGDELLAEIEALKCENAHLKKTVAELVVDKSILTEAVEILKKKHRVLQLKR